MRSIIGALLVMGAAASAIAEEPTPSGVPPCVDNCAAPVDARFVIENDYVQVLRLSIPAHARTPMHDVTARVSSGSAMRTSSIATPTARS
jgi:hypothetical protein